MSFLEMKTSLQVNVLPIGSGIDSNTNLFCAKSQHFAFTSRFISYKGLGSDIMRNRPLLGFSLAYVYSLAAFSVTEPATPVFGSHENEDRTGTVKSVSSRLYVFPVVPSLVVASEELNIIDLILLMVSAAETGAVKCVWNSLVCAV